MASEETWGALSIAIGGSILMFIIGEYVRADIGPLIYMTVFGFLAFLLIGLGLYSIVRAATSTSHR
jgi:uncharacterized membrane protein YjjP (DUF1212 family)